jgi:hypothetical protein
MLQQPYPDGLPAGARIDYSPRPPQNGAAYASVVFGVLWVVCLVMPIIIAPTIPSGVVPPEWLQTLAGLAVWFGGPFAIIFGHVGLYRALRHRELRGSLGWAIAGVLLGYLWLALLGWVTHIF